MEGVNTAVIGTGSRGRGLAEMSSQRDEFHRRIVENDPATDALASACYATTSQMTGNSLTTSTPTTPPTPTASPRATTPGSKST